jgi:hypothetical protein
MEEMKWGRSMAPAALWLVSARMQQGSSIAVMVGELMVSAWMVQERSMAAGAGGQVVELR